MRKKLNKRKYSITSIMLGTIANLVSYLSKISVAIQITIVVLCGAITIVIFWWEANKADEEEYLQKLLTTAEEVKEDWVQEVKEFRETNNRNPDNKEMYAIFIEALQQSILNKKDILKLQLLGVWPMSINETDLI